MPPNPEPNDVQAPINANGTDNDRNTQSPDANPSPLRQLLKYSLIILSGFLLGVVLGMLSTSLVLYFVPPTWLEHALRHRKTKMQEHAQLRQMCRGAAAATGRGFGGGAGLLGGGGGGQGAGGGFVERYDGAENVVEICTCWPGGVSEMGGWFLSCAKVGLMGYVEIGAWGTEAMTVGG